MNKQERLVKKRNMLIPKIKVDDSFKNIQGNQVQVVKIGSSPKKQEKVQRQASMQEEN